MKNKFPKPTKEELEQIKKVLFEKYDVVIPKLDLIMIIDLIKELNWWLKSKQSSNDSIIISEETAIEFRDLVKQVRGEEISLADACEEAKTSLVMTEYKEKERISKEIRAILVARMPIPYDLAVEGEIVNLFKLQYDAILTRSQLEQVIQYLTRVLWLEEGLDASLGKCLADLLIYSDKLKRGKRVNGLKLHDELRKAIDVAVGRLNILSTGWERLYREK